MSATTPDETTDAPQAATERCGQCGAPASPDQRYCVSCGFHRRNAPDPVARYLSDASVARARVAAATALAAQRRRARRIGLRAVAMLVALALLVGMAIGAALAGGSAKVESGSTKIVPGPSAKRQPGASAGMTHATSKGTAKLQNATGSRYLQQEQNLPDSVTP